MKKDIKKFMLIMVTLVICVAIANKAFNQKHDNEPNVVTQTSNNVQIDKTTETEVTKKDPIANILNLIDYYENLEDEKRHQYILAKKALDTVKAEFNAASMQHNKLYIDNVCIDSNNFMTSYSLEKESIEYAFVSQKATVDQYRQWAQICLDKSNNAKAVNDTVNYLKHKAEYWECIQNIDYFSTRWYLEFVACAKDLQLCIENADMATYGIITHRKVNRIKKGMTLAQVEHILGKGQHVRQFSYNDGPISIELDEYIWNCVIDNCRLTLTFDSGSLYMKNASWGGNI